MRKKRSGRNRRTLIKTSGSLSAGPMLAAGGAAADVPTEGGRTRRAIPLSVPTRPFGNSGYNLPILALGGYFDALHNQSLLDQALRLGITYWETSFSFDGAKEGFGTYLKRNPDCRNRLFLSAKTPCRDPEGMSQDLEETLRALQTTYIDFFVVHAVDDAACLNTEMRRWVDRAKAEGKIRLFGFSTHSNMETCMVHASKLGWIDGIMTTYNYRLMHRDEMKRAIDSCVKAGIGLNAIKSQAELTNPKATIGVETDKALKMTEEFIGKGFTFQQAKLKVVWGNSHITSICSLMPTKAILLANAAAALDRTELSAEDLSLLEHYGLK
jgi:predicted aldo/keto reductase-like oxidoreductase